VSLCRALLTEAGFLTFITGLVVIVGAVGIYVGRLWERESRS
jgi:uncharacterized membrane protein